MNKTTVKVIFFTSLIITVAVLIIYYLNFRGLPISKNNQDWAYFGDYFSGVLSPIFALLAFLALIYSTYIQERERLTSSTESHYLQTIQQLDQTLENLLLTPPSIAHHNSYPTYKHIFIAHSPHKDHILAWPDCLYGVIECFNISGTKEFAHFNEMHWVYTNLYRLIQAPPTGLKDSLTIHFYKEKTQRLESFFKLKNNKNIKNDPRAEHPTVSQ